MEYSSRVLTGVKHPWANFEWDTKYKIAIPRKLRVTNRTPRMPTEGHPKSWSYQEVSALRAQLSCHMSKNQN